MKITKDMLYFFWGIFFTGLATSYVVEYTKNLITDSIISYFVLFFVVLFGLLSLDKCKELKRIKLEQETEQLKNEYRLIKETRHLTPEDFQFRVMLPGEELKNSERPYFNKYIDRKAIPYESIPANKPSYTEHDLVKLLEQGNNILLIGNPTEGKTRTLLEVTKKLNDFLAISLLINKQPSDKALQLIEGKKVIWLFDDLNTYESNAYDFQHTFNQLKKITSLCVLAATCRDGPELKKNVQENVGQLHKIYNLFDYKLTLEPAKDDQKEELKKALNETETRLFPTLGSICMRKHFEFMRKRFDDLQEFDKNSLRSILLLFSGFIYPFTHQRIKGVLTDIFGHEKNNIDEPRIRASLNNLVTNGFITSPKDVYPIIPEAAYITKPENEFYYPINRDVQKDKANLVNCLTKQKDADGLNKLAKSYYFSDDKNFALLIWEQIINDFKSPNEDVLLEQVCEALLNKGLALGQPHEYKEAIQCFDDLVKRFGNSQELVLQEQVAKALYNKGVRLGQFNKIEGEIQCYDDLLERFSDSQELVLQEQVAKVLINKGARLGQLDTIEGDKGEIQCYDDLLERFGNSRELVLREKVTAALLNKSRRMFLSRSTIKESD